MKKHLRSNLLYTLSFLIIFGPLCYLLYDYVLDFALPPVPAKEALSETNTVRISANRNFSNIDEHAEKVTVLMYHQIIPESQLKKQHFTDTGELVDMVVTLEEFSDQMKYLKQQNFTILSLKEFELFMTNKMKVPPKSVLITFDDGYKNVFKFAYPVLQKHGFYAVHFIITELITNRTVKYDSSYLQYASIDEVVKAADVFDYGNHTHSLHHRNKNGKSFLVVYSRDKIKKDLVKANKWLGRSTAFAPPFGEYTTSTLKILKDLNIEMAFTVDPGYAEPSQHILEIPRQLIYPFYDIEDFKYIVEQKIDYHIQLN
ncbi:hypothetical protein GCM10011351_06730 [Paraliobacillus quinghaiensis]|uniref:NodB homology domain-containing protein n=1 Tax=Paraliobacillus quinghaiensis TaxID=470815 RepID=A0A917WRR5_9BACI|nr:polysaccharide deacetylase family protein [Paraliobacillus quinghaiensis]GGM23604.1 hypothetical protein GCM10011351_06730 [Paraliobacillus quinghaiensis]